VSTHVRCPACGAPAANIASPNERWGQIFDGRELDHASESSDDDAHDYTFLWNDGRETFECPCGVAIWIASRQRPDGRWFTANEDAPAELPDGPCTCDQHGDYCPQHVNCACGCPKHAHDSEGCLAGSLRCHGCTQYRPAKLRRFEELGDDQLDELGLLELRRAYQALRGHHIEETTALWRARHSKGAIR
jgi:hypothetical protein